MSEAITIARPYAEAVLCVANAENKLEEWSSWLLQLAKMTDLAEFHALIKNPKIATTQLIAFFIEALGKPASETLRAFIAVLVENNRLNIFGEIASLFFAFKRREEGSLHAQVVSATPIEGAQLEELLKHLEQKFSRKIIPTLIVDETLIGGVRIIVGDVLEYAKVLDYSIQASLKQMRRALTA